MMHPDAPQLSGIVFASGYLSFSYQGNALLTVLDRTESLALRAPYGGVETTANMRVVRVALNEQVLEEYVRQRIQLALKEHDLERLKDLRWAMDQKVEEIRKELLEKVSSLSAEHAAAIAMITAAGGTVASLQEGITFTAGASGGVGSSSVGGGNGNGAGSAGGGP